MIRRVSCLRGVILLEKYSKCLFFQRSLTIFRLFSDSRAHQEIASCQHRISDLKSDWTRLKNESQAYAAQIATLLVSRRCWSSSHPSSCSFESATIEGEGEE